MQAREEAYRQETEGAKEGGRLLTDYACGLIAFENNKAYGFTCRYFGAERTLFLSLTLTKSLTLSLALIQG